jgi:hypothetical protein
MLADLFSDSGIRVSDPHDVLFRIYAVCEDCARRGLVRLGDPAVFAPVDVDGAVTAPASQAQVQPPPTSCLISTPKETLKCAPPLPPCKQQQQQCWNCEVCTFENSDLHSQACGVCNSPNPHLQSWACTACSFQNTHMHLDACDVCNSPRIPVAKPRAQGLHSSSVHVMAIALNFSRHQTKRRKIVISPRIHQWTLSSFVLAFLKRRLGGGACAAALATRFALYDCSASVSAARRRALNDLVLRRVFGGVGADVIARSARTEMSRMLHEARHDTDIWY